MNEQQRITFTASSEKLRLTFKSPGGSRSAEWSPAADNATIKAAVEEVYDGTVTVTGSRTSSGSSPNRTFSGTATIVFSGDLANTDVPIVDVRQGEVQHLETTSPTGDYTWAGSDPFQPGDTVADIQVLVRAEGGNQANVNVSGTSTAASGDGANLALGLTPTFQVTLYPERIPYLTDGSSGSGGQGVAMEIGNDDFLTFDLGSPQALSEIRIYLESVGDSRPYSFDFSNTGVFGGEETNLSGTFGPSGDFWLEVAASQTARYVRIQLTGAPREVEILGLPANAVLTLDFRYPPSLGNIATQYTSTGTGTTDSTTIQGDSVPSSISVETIADGAPLLNTKLIYNHLTESGVSAVFDQGGATEIGWVATQHVVDSMDPTAVLSGVFKHSDTGDFEGEEETICTFPDVSLRDAVNMSSDSAVAELKRYVRYEYTITGGTDPGFAILPGIGPGQFSED